ncbi:unnamed protein product [Thlaspi arvense]|uniref:Serpin domain-containing protein n=1 Tax=Thlaspi arvense TaxID=13288 RepID=A0AAU9TB80_THLAR|nr:unnamed protein product [Thlaspi arvense]
MGFRSKAEKVRVELNAWASNHTNGLIKDLLPRGSITEQTDIVYGNALYFKGEWEVPFNKSHTRDEEFHLLNGTSVSVPFMSSRKDQYIKAYDGFKVLRIPYRQGGKDTKRQGIDANGSFPYLHGFGDNKHSGFSYGHGFGDDTKCGSFSMYFYLPDKKDGLDDLVKTMASTSGFLDSHIPRFKESVSQFRIPKFKIGDGLRGKELGFNSLPLHHKACCCNFYSFFSGGCCVSKPRYVDFVADHPFLFLIREDKTGTVLFVGQIYDPSIKS